LATPILVEDGVSEPLLAYPLTRRDRIKPDDGRSIGHPEKAHIDESKSKTLK